MAYEQDELPIETSLLNPTAVATQAKLAQVLTDYDVVEIVENGGDPFLIVSEKRQTQASDLYAGPPGELPGITFSEPTTDVVPYQGGITAQQIVEVQQSRQLAAVDEAQVNIAELGTSSPSPFTSWIRREYNTDLQGIKGLQNYDKMRKSDGVVRGTLRVVKTPVLAARWFIEPASPSTQDKNKADFVWRCFTEFMSISFPQVLTEALLMADFGYYMFEKVWEPKIVNGQKRWVWQKLAPRHPMDVKTWYYDENGGPAGVCMYAPFIGGQYYGSAYQWQQETVNGQVINNRPPYLPGTPTPFLLPDGTRRIYADDEIEIPISKLLVFTFDREAGNVEGISVLRSAYKHWYYKEQLYKIDAIQKERHGIGIPVIKLPPSYTPADKAAAENLGRNLRTNERAHVVLPPFWELLFAKLEGNVVDALKSVAVHDEAIRENILAGFNGVNKPTKSEDQSMFLKATRFIAEILCETFNQYGIPELVDMNFASTEKYPRIRVRRIGEQDDWRTMSFAIRNLIGAGVITVDDVLEDHIRREMDLPPRDPSTARVLPTPQSAPPTPPAGSKQNKGKQDQAAAGMPRQVPKPPVGIGKGNAGVDRSGGK